MMKKKIIDIIVASVSVLAIVGIGGGTTLHSLSEYNKYYEENYPEIDPADNAILLSLRAELKPDVHYYKNNKAKPVRNDFIVIGTYQPKDLEEGEGIFEQALDPVKRPFSIEAHPLFAMNGGEIVISFGGFTVTLDVVLEDVVLSNINIVQNPYTIIYQQGQVFSRTGMVVEAIYNDGSKKELGNLDYNISKTTALTLEDTSIAISFSEGDITITKSLNISVVPQLNNGEIVKIESTKQYFIIEHGKNINSAEIFILATYQSGNKKIIPQDAYEISNEDDKAMLGKAYALDVRLTANQNIKTKVWLKVISHIEGEDCVVVGGKQSKTETEFLFINGEFIEVGDVTFAGGFGATVNEGGVGYIQYSIFSAAQTNASITMRCANSFLEKIDDSFWMKPLIINTIADLKINGEDIVIDDDVILAGCGPADSYKPLYNVYSEFTFEDIPLKVGENEIKLQFKKSTLGEINYFEESPSTMNIDYIVIECEGYLVSQNARIKEIYFAENLSLNYGDNFDDIDFLVFAKYMNNEVCLLSPNDVTISKPSGYVTIGNHEISASLKLDNSKTCTKTFTVSSFILEAEDAILSGNNKVKAETGTEFSSVDQSVLGTVTVVSGMDNSSMVHVGETSITFVFEGVEGSHGLVVRCDNTYFFGTGVLNKAPYYTKDINLEQCVDIFVNGIKIDFSIAIPSLPASLEISEDNIPWWTFFELSVGNIELISGENTIKIVGKSSAPKNRWYEPSVPKFDYIKITAPN